MRKLLKYDLKSISRPWLIASAAMLIMAIVGAFSLRTVTDMGSQMFVLGSQMNFAEQSAYSMAIILLILSFLCFGAYAFFSIFISLRRFYSNLFTGEGYLTFTLPVKKIEILNSKILMYIINAIRSGAVIVFCVLIMLFIGVGTSTVVNDSQSFFAFLSMLWTESFKEMGAWLLIYLVQAFICVVAFSVYEGIFLYLCITIGSVISSKNKILAAVGVYFAGNTLVSIISSVVQTVLTSSSISLIERMNAGLLSGDGMLSYAFIALVIFAITLIPVVLGYILYIVIVTLLEKKLNI